MTAAKPSPRGALIVLEGIDGAGKTTQIDLLAESLRALGETVVQSKEPTTGAWGQKIRASAASGRMSPAEELEAFIMDRREHVREVIQPGLDAGAFVLLDRYFYSTIAYQGSRGGDVDGLREQMREFPRPTRVYVLDVDPEIGLQRVSSRDGQPNHFESVDQLTLARAIFLRMNSDITAHIDGASTIEAVHRRILEDFWGLKGPGQVARCAKHWLCDDVHRCVYAASGECEWMRLRGLALARD